jgi:hypothetical protein
MIAYMKAHVKGFRDEFPKLVLEGAKSPGL